MRNFLGPGLALAILLLVPATAAETSFDSGNLAPGATYQYTFTEVLESGFYYSCLYHGSDDTMVHVVDDSDGATTTHAVSITGTNADLTRYSPQHLVIEVGDTVMWTNDSETHHTVTYDDEATQMAAGQDEHHMESGDDHDHGAHDHEKGTPGFGLVAGLAILGTAALGRRP